MTTRPPFDEHDALSPEERALAARLSAIDVGGPSAALDARILAAARAATGAPAASTAPAVDRALPPARPAAATSRPPGRRPRRWPTAVGAAATLVIAVGLAWQLKPLLDMPPPLRPRAQAPSAPDVEVLARAEPVAPVPSPAPPVATADATPPAAAERGPRAVAPRVTPPQAKAAPPLATATEAAVAADADYVDEAIGDTAHPPAPAAAAAAAPAAAPPQPALRLADEAPEVPEPVVVTGSRLRAQGAPAAAEAAGDGTAFPPVASDAALAPLDWLQRIRERRDAGRVDEARASLRRFVRAYPRQRLPDDLRPLLAPPG